MKTHNLDLDLDLPSDIPDLPPPWPETAVAIEWWMQRAQWPSGAMPLDERLSLPFRTHYDQPFVLR